MNYTINEHTPNVGFTVPIRGTIIRDETVMQNIIIWVDGTLRPWRNHHNCTGVWEFDGQFFTHPPFHPEPED